METCTYLADYFPNWWINEAYNKLYKVYTWQPEKDPSGKFATHKNNFNLPQDFLKKSPQWYTPTDKTPSPLASSDFLESTSNKKIAKFLFNLSFKRVATRAPWIFLTSFP